MKKFSSILFVLVALTALMSCNDYETYADMKEKERDYISDFIAYKHINVISEEVFKANGNKTNVDANEYAYMNNTGVYMQIVRKGPGSQLEDKVTTELQIRFKEISLFDTTKVVSNYLDSYDPDVMSITKSGVNLTASFIYGTMLITYGASVPSGWMVPLNYINVGAPTATEDIAKVRLIVPHTQGHSVANSNVYPYYYEITFQKAPGL